MRFLFLTLGFFFVLLFNGHAQEQCRFLNDPPLTDQPEKDCSTLAYTPVKPQFKDGYAGFVRRAWEQMCLPQSIADTMRSIQKVLCSFIITKTGEVKHREIYSERNEFSEQVARFLLALPDFKPGRNKNNEIISVRVYFAFFFKKSVRYIAKDPSIIPIFPCGTPGLEEMAGNNANGKLFFVDIQEKTAASL